MIEKSSTPTPSSGAVLSSCSCMRSLLSRQPKAALGNEAALNLVGSDTDDPHQGMTQVLLETPVVDRPGHLLRKRGAHAENLERGLAKALHQLAGKDLADRAVFRRRHAVRGKIRAMHHQLAADLDLAGERRHPVPDERVVAKR